MRREILADGVDLYCGDSREVIKALPDNHFDSCVTDPPYALVSIVKRFGSPNAAPAKGNDAYMRASAGFMGKTWDTGEVAMSAEFWAEVLRVLKPGAHLVAFGASRGYHRMACAIEDAGFEIRDSLMWIYSQGFPKSHNLDNKRGELICGCDPESSPERDVRPVCDADLSAAEHAGNQCGEILQSGMSQPGAPGAVDARYESACNGASQRPDQSVMEGRGDIPPPSRQLPASEVRSLSGGICDDGANGWLCDGASPCDGETHSSSVDTDRVRSSPRSSAAAQRRNESRIVAGQSQSQDGGAWPCCRRCGKPVVPRGLGSSLKPAFEPIVLARKPLSEKTVAANVLRWGTGALNIDGCRVGIDPSIDDPRLGGKGAWHTTKQQGGHTVSLPRGTVGSSELGRWPANVLHDGSAEVVEAFPNTKSGQLLTHHKRSGGQNIGTFAIRDRTGEAANFGGDSGSAARFFYSAKADSDDRLGSKHPTVKPIDLMQWLIRLITPKGGVVLDPFAGTGTTGEAAIREGMCAALIEREEEYQGDIRRRVSLAISGPTERRRETLKASGKVDSHEALPLFGGAV